MSNLKAWAICAVALALSACSHTPEPSPADAGFSAERLHDIEIALDEAVAAGRIPSAIAMVAHGDRMIWLDTAGEMAPGEPMRDDVIMPLASAGKMYTAVAAMILVERGAIGLDDPVSRYIPEFANVQVVVGEGDDARLEPAATPITIRHLLTHTGGLRMSGDGFWAAWNANVGRTTTLHMARALAALPLESQPGTRFSYAPTGASYEALAAVIEIASGQSLEDFMQQNIFTPLGLRDTYFYVPDNKARRVPAFYRRADDALARDLPEPPRSAYFHGGGGVAASPADILRFAQIFLNDGEVDGARILRADTVRAMMSDQLGPLADLPGGLSWGYGAAVPRGAAADAPSQYGWVGGGYAMLWVDRTERMVGYLAFPLRPPGDNGLLQDFRRMVYAARQAQ